MRAHEVSPTDAHGSGVVWIVHVVPFHLSAKGASAPELLTYCPTAVQADDEEQETSARELLVAPAGFGVLCSVQPSPLIDTCCIAKVPLSPLFPAAVQAVEVRTHWTSSPMAGVQSTSCCRSSPVPAFRGLYGRDRAGNRRGAQL